MKSITLDRVRLKKLVKKYSGKSYKKLLFEYAWLESEKNQIISRRNYFASVFAIAIAIAGILISSFNSEYYKYIYSIIAIILVLSWMILGIYYILKVARLEKRMNAIKIVLKLKEYENNCGEDISQKFCSNDKIDQ